MHLGRASDLSLQAFFFLCKSILSLFLLTLLSYCCTQTKINDDNNRLCIIVWKSVYMTKYLNVLGFFYSFVYDTSLEMCLNGNVLL